MIETQKMYLQANERHKEMKQKLSELESEIAGMKLHYKKDREKLLEMKMAIYKNPM